MMAQIPKAHAPAVMLPGAENSHRGKLENALQHSPVLARLCLRGCINFGLLARTDMQLMCTTNILHSAEFDRQEACT